MTLDAWLAMCSPKSRWAARSRAVMRAAIEPLLPIVGLEDPGIVDSAALLAAVDAAYPFGERKMHPYKCWLAERRILIDALNDTSLLNGANHIRRDAPTSDDLHACEVAHDLVELGREDEARKLLEEQAPRRLNRKCPACSEPSGKPCIDHVSETINRRTGTPLSISMARSYGVCHVPRIVPHLARLTVESGPLFACDQADAMKER